MIFQEEYLKLTLSLSLKKNPFFIFSPGEHSVSLGESQNKFLYYVKQEKEKQIPVKVLKVNNHDCNIDLLYDTDTKQVKTDISDVDDSTLFVKSSKSKPKPYNREIVVSHNDGTETVWRLILNEGKKSHIVNRYTKNGKIFLEKKTVDTAKYCYYMNCPNCGEIRYCRPSSIKLVKQCNACALDRTREKKAEYVRRKRKENNDKSKNGSL